ncbi:hypothetical protein PAERUG_P18_London_17_VIM_2_04_10_04627 [Pseudomonas aeruginosa]|nr:hypothetical protein PAERUG_P18_London_17_VIM_2_04_10_04627 [Pseudomonas aeruginosa]
MVAGRADTAERRAAGGAGELLVPVDDAGAAFHEELLETLAGIRQQPGGQAVLGGVGFTDRRSEIGVADHLQQRPEELFVRSLGHRADVEDARGQQGGAVDRLGHRQQRLCALADQMLLGLEQVLGGAQRNHRAHERRRLFVEATDPQGSADRHQARQQCVAPGALRHQQAAGAGATLACGDEGGLDDGVDGGVEVGDLLHHQRVVAAHLQRQDFLRLAAKLAVQQVAGATGPGEEQTVEPTVGGQRDAGFATTLDQVEHAGRQAGLDPGLERQLGDLRGQLAGLEHHAVTGQQRRDDMPVGQVAGEIVGTEYRHHAMRLVP